MGARHGIRQHTAAIGRALSLNPSLFCAVGAAGAPNPTSFVRPHHGPATNCETPHLVSTTCPSTSPPPATAIPWTRPRPAVFPPTRSIPATPATPAIPGAGTGEHDVCWAWPTVLATRSPRAWAPWLCPCHHARRPTTAATVPAVPAAGSTGRHAAVWAAHHQRGVLWHGRG